METPRRYVYRKSWGEIMFDALLCSGPLLFLGYPIEDAMAGSIFSQVVWQGIWGFVVLGAFIVLAGSVIAAVARVRGWAWLELEEDAVVAPHWFTMRHTRIPIGSITQVWEYVNETKDPLTSLYLKGTAGMRRIEANMFETQAEYDDVRDFIRNHPELRCRWSKPRSTRAEGQGEKCAAR